MNDEKILPRGQRGFFEKRVPVCSHINEKIRDGNLNKKINVHPMCVQVYEDSYNIIWFCNKCKSKYSLPDNGAYIYDAGDDLEILLTDLNGYEISTDVNCNPHMDFFNEEKNYSIEEEKFIGVTNGFNDDPVLNDKKLICLPFGVVKKIM